jgi:PleD family two-component response regulator
MTGNMGGTEAKGALDSLDALIKRADEALYRAKNAGCDRYEIG